MCTDNTFVKKKNTSIQSCMNICIMQTIQTQNALSTMEKDYKMQTIQTQNALSTMEKDYNKLDFFFTCIMRIVYHNLKCDFFV